MGDRRADWRARTGPAKAALDQPTDPSVLLAPDVIPATGRSEAEMARRLGISRQTLSDILGRRRPVAPQIAARLGKLFGSGPGHCVRMQAAHDL